MDMCIEQENNQVKYMGDKIKMNRHFKQIKEQNQKWVHLHWSEWFWNVDSGLSEDLGEVAEETKGWFFNIKASFS